MEDTTSPGIEKITAKGNTITVQYSETLDTNFIPSINDWVVKQGSTAQTITSITISGNKILLTLSGSLTEGSTVKVSYTSTSTLSNGRDLAGNVIPDRSESAVINATDNTAASVISAKAEGGKIIITFDDILDPSKAPSASDFTVTDNGTGINVAGLTVSGRKITLDLASPVSVGATVKLTFTKGGANNAITDKSGNVLNAISEMTISNEQLALSVTKTDITADTDKVYVKFDRELDKSMSLDTNKFTVMLVVFVTTLQTLQSKARHLN